MKTMRTLIRTRLGIILAFVALFTTFTGNVFAADNVTVSFDLNYPVYVEGEGLVTPSPQTVESGTFLTDPGEPSYEGYEFTGWYTGTSKDAAKWDFILQPATQSFTLYAHWRKNYILSFDLNDKEGIDGQPAIPAVGQPVDIETYEGDKTVSVPDPTRQGYDFIQWENSDGEKWDFALWTPITKNDSITAHITLHAVWKQVEYNVTFDCNDGTSVDELVVPVPYGERIPTDKIPEATRNIEYVFDGWHTSSTFDTPIDFTIERIVAPLTVHAHWTQKSYTIVFDLNDEADATGQPEIQTVIYNHMVKKPADPVRFGYRFEGWLNEPFGKPAYIWDFSANFLDDNAAPDGILTLRAQWHKVYLITLDPNYIGATPSVKEVPAPEGGKLEAPGEITRPGHAIKGWYTEKVLNYYGCENEEDSAAYEARIVWDFEDDDFKQSRTLYAQWITDTLSIYLYPNYIGATPSFCTIRVPYGDILNTSLIPVPEAFQRPGYEMSGWTTDAQGENWWSISAPFTIDHAALFTQWKPVTYTVTFDLNDIPPSAGITKPDNLTNVEAGTLLTDPGLIAPNGYRFNKWHTDPVVVSPWSFGESTVKKSITLYLHWDRDNIVVTFTPNYDAWYEDDVTLEIGYGDKISASLFPNYNQNEGNYIHGWARDEQGLSMWDINTDVVIAPITLYAIWWDPIMTIDAIPTVTLDGARYFDLAGRPVSTPQAGRLYLIITPDGQRRKVIYH